MVVTMVAMGMVQMPINQVVGVVAVRHGFVSATRPMHMARFVSRATMIGRAAVRIGRRNFERVLVDMITVDMVKVTVMQIIDVPVMLHGRVAAGRAMLVRMVGMVRCIAVGHRRLHRFVRVSGRIAGYQSV